MISLREARNWRSRSCCSTGISRAERGVHVHGFGNPHYWLDPENARPITERIQGALARLSPADAALFEANRPDGSPSGNVPVRAKLGSTTGRR
jgi:hypothetical protein